MSFNTRNKHEEDLKKTVDKFCNFLDRKTCTEISHPSYHTSGKASEHEEITRVYKDTLKKIIDKMY